MSFANRTDAGPRVFGIAAAVVVGAIAFFASMGPAALDPTRLDWIFIGGLDTSMQFVGWHMFRYDDWSWPPGATPSYGYPVGVPAPAASRCNCSARRCSCCLLHFFITQESRGTSGRSSVH